MIENHNICDFQVFHNSFEPFNYLGHRDKQVIRQCIQNFAVVIGLVRSNTNVPKVLEMGAGLSTVIFSKLLNNHGETIKTIDAFSHDAIQTNSRGTSVNFDLSELKNCEIIEGITIGYDELNDFYQSPRSSLISLSHDEVVSNLDYFINMSMDDRKYQQINRLLDLKYFSPSLVKNYFIKNSLFVNDLFASYRTDKDEFEFLKNHNGKPVLTDALKSYAPNIIYLDSGEYSSNIEFNIINEVAKKGTLLIVQDIFFPKSIKSFLIASALMSSDSWRVLWIDRTTPQGMIICRKEK